MQMLQLSDSSAHDSVFLRLSFEASVLECKQHS